MGKSKVLSTNFYFSSPLSWQFWTVKCEGVKYQCAVLGANSKPYVCK